MTEVVRSGGVRKAIERVKEDEIEKEREKER